jgi:hypothetical protein
LRFQKGIVDAGILMCMHGVELPSHLAWRHEPRSSRKALINFLIVIPAQAGIQGI